MTCSFSECDHPVRTTFLCVGHYGQQWRGEELRPLRGSVNRSERSRFYISVEEQKRECSTCHVIKPFEEFHYHPGKLGVKSRCILCTRAGVNSVSYQRHGLTKDQFVFLLEKAAGRCEVCQSEKPADFRWRIDHDHRCCPGKWSCGQCVRGLLCGTCNSGLGMLGDDPGALERAAKYLRAYGQNTQ